MTPKRRFLIWLSSVIVAAICGFLGAQLYGWASAPKAPDSNQPLAFIGNSPVTREEVDRVIPYFRGEILAQVLLNRMVARSEGGKKAKVDHKELVYPKHLRTRDEFVAFGSMLYARRLMRKVVLLPWPKERLQRFFVLFKEELVQYDVSFLRLARREDKNLVQADIESDIDFHSLVARYAADETGRKLSWSSSFRRIELLEQFGEEAGKSILRLEVGGRPSVLVVNGDVYVVRLGRVRAQFDQIRPWLEDRIVEACLPELCYQAIDGGKISLGEPMGRDLKILDFRL